jgi:hypothetical protein
MKNKIIIIGLLLGVISFYSCSKLFDANQPDDPKVKYSSTYPLSGEWWVKYYADEAGTEDVGGGYFPLYTYNTAANDGKEFWISDQGSFWTYTVKCPVNMTSKTFAGNELVSTVTDYDIKVNVTLGKVIVNGGRSTSGVVTDSIYMALEYEDDPGTIYYAAGVRRTGFLEDEW